MFTSRCPRTTLPTTDAFQAAYRTPELFTRMIADGLTGRKGGKGGFYRIKKTDAGKVKESINLKTGEYAVSSDSKNPTVKAAGKNLCSTLPCNRNFSHFGPDSNLFGDLENLFKNYALSGQGRSRRYIHDADEATRYGGSPGTFTSSSLSVPGLNQAG